MGFIRVLPPETSRLIAAGEVIERPASALRELIDNAIDSGASDIAIRIEEGGIGLISVVDDGSGMDEADLALACLPHATSKIASADDLLRARSLGFRGEALASVAAAARLDIVSKDSDSASAHRLVSRPGEAPRIEACAGRRGTSVSVSGLFQDFPARRQFLKRPQAEASLCRQAFEDKALAHPAIGFRYESGASAPTILRPASRVDRAARLFPELDPSFLHLVKFSGQGFEGELVIAGPAFSRPDRRLMAAFVNRRKVQEFGLIGALDYAFSGYLPGGLHPFALVFLEIDPALADFNIHPAKKEVRFKDPESPKRAMIHAVQAFLGELGRRDPGQALPDPSAELEFDLEPAALPSERIAFAPVPRADELTGHAQAPMAETGGFAERRCANYSGRARAADSAASRDWSAFDEVRERAAAGELAHLPAPTARGEATERDFRYLGQALGPFLVFERRGELWFLDQHAAHERMLFDELSAKPAASQELLVPDLLEPEDEVEDELIAGAASRLAEAGFRLERDGRAWIVAAAPPELASGAAQAARELARESGDARRAALAMAACRAAVKDGDRLDDQAAEELIARALRLPEPRCPHGRPIWAKITREQLYRLVRREV